MKFTKSSLKASYNKDDASFVLEVVVLNIGEDLLHVVRESRTQLSGRVVSSSRGSRRALCGDTECVCDAAQYNAVKQLVSAAGAELHVCGSGTRFAQLVALQLR